MNFLKSTAWMLFGGLIGGFIMAVQVARTSFDVPTVFGTVTCFKLDPSLKNK